MKNRIIAMLMVIVMTISLVPSMMLNASAADVSQPTFSVESTWAVAGSTIEVNVNIDNNPGLYGATLNISWSEGLTLVDAENGSVFNGLAFQEPSRYQSTGTNFLWYGTNLREVQDGTVLKLTFQVADTALPTSRMSVNISGKGLTDINDREIIANYVPGNIRVIDYLPGDTTSDGEITTADLVDLAKYISDGCITDPNGFNVSINDSAADVNDDGEISTLDLVLIAKYISDGCVTDPEGFNVTLKPSTSRCRHTDMTEVPYKAATCTEAGNVTYFYCDDCGKYFNSAEATVELTWDQVVLVSAGHNTVIDEAVAPTHTSTGLTEGSHCSVCGEVFVAQEIVPVLQANYHSITYHNLKTAEYPEVTQYAEHLGTELPEPAAPGYEFMGWYAESDYRTIVDRIPANSTQDYHLYAKWEMVTYNIYFDPANAPEHDNPTTYTVEDRIILRDPTWAGLAFTGWTDADGKSWKEIPKGTTGDLDLTANWKLMRNIATLGTNTLMESKYDVNTKLYTFIYELGTIEHVVLEELNANAPNTYYHNGAADFTLSVEQTIEMSEEIANSIAKTISKSVSSSSEWERSKEWAEEQSIEHSAGTSIGLEIGDGSPVKATIEASYGYANASGKSWGESSTEGGSYGTETENGEETSSSLAYTTTLSTTTSASVTIPKDSPEGYYSYAHVGNIRVFGVVTYNANDGRVYLNTYSMLDNMHDMLLYYPDINTMNHPTCETLQYKIPRDNIEEILNKSYYIEYNGNGGVIKTEDGKVVENGKMSTSLHTIGGEEKLLNNEFVREGYIFQGWESRNEDGTVKSNFTNGQIINDIANKGELVTLYAQWTPIGYTVEYKNELPDGCTSEVQNMPWNKELKYDENLTLPNAPVLPGYTFAGWYWYEQTTDEASNVTTTEFRGDAGQVLEKANLAKEQDKVIEITAKWTANQYNVTLDANGGSMINQSMTVTYDELYGAIPEPTRNDHVFMGWYLPDGTKVDGDNTRVAITGDHTITAKWLKIKAKIYYRDDTYNPGDKDVVIDDDDFFYSELVDPKFNRAELKAAGYTKINIKVHFQLNEIDQGNQHLRLEACYDLNVPFAEWKFDSTPSGWTSYEREVTIDLSSEFISETCNFFAGYDAYGNGNDDWYLGDTCYTVTALKN